MMQHNKKTQGMLVAAALASATFSQVATAEISASAGVASTYLFRGVDQSNGYPQVYGDLTLSTDLGLYASVWGSSAGSGSQEYDLIVGWAKEFNAIEFNIGAVNYVYPNSGAGDDLGAESEAFVGISGAGFEAYLYRNVASSNNDNEDFMYFAASYVYKRVAFTLGYGMDDSVPNTTSPYNGEVDDGKYAYGHLDFTYAFNDNLTFTFSKMVYRNAEAGGAGVGDDRYGDLANADGRFGAIADADLLFVVNYSLPLAY